MNIKRRESWCSSNAIISAVKIYSLSSTKKVIFINANHNVLTHTVKRTWRNKFAIIVRKSLFMITVINVKNLVKMKLIIFKKNGIVIRSSSAKIHAMQGLSSQRILKYAYLIRIAKGLLKMVPVFLLAKKDIL